MKRIMLILVGLLFCSTTMAWEGIDKITGSRVTIEPLVRVGLGHTVLMKDHRDNYWHHFYIQSIKMKNGKMLKLKGFDKDLGVKRVIVRSRSNIGM